MPSRLSFLSLLLCFQFAACQAVEQNASSKPTSYSPSLGIASSTPLPQKPLFISTDFGLSWTDASANLPAGLQVSFLEPQGAELVLASDNMGLFISQESRSKWTAIGESLPGKKINALHVGDQIILAGVYQKGLYQTSDSGNTWQSMNYDLPNLTVQSIWQTKDRLLAGTDDGIFYLPKNAQQWQPTNIKTQVLSIYEYDNILVAGTSDGTIISLDGGKTWKWIRREGAVHYTHNIGSRVIELVLTGDVVYSDDLGKNWAQTTYGPRQGSYVYEIIAAGEYLLMSNNYGVHRSADNGKSWQLIHPVETMAFFDFQLIDNTIYGGTRVWDEFRGR